MQKCKNQKNLSLLELTISSRLVGNDFYYFLLSREFVIYRAASNLVSK